MTRGKIQIKRIENATNRQVTYSKRRNGLFKKAHELTVLCDAKVSIIIFSSTDKLQEYISPNITTKEVFDQYQQIAGVDLWKTHYEKMEETLRKLRDVNRNLRKQIRQRLGESLNELDYHELRRLEEEMDHATKVVRERKYKVLSNTIDTTRKKNRSREDIHAKLMHELARAEDPHYGLVDNGGDYESVMGYHIGGSRAFGLRLQPTHHALHSGPTSDLTTFHLLE